MSDLPVNCPKPCWYAYMHWDVGGWKMRLPLHFLEFVQFVRSQAKERVIIGWGLSRGANWLIELVRQHAGLLDGAVMFAGYPQKRCQYEQVASAQELIAVRNCDICMVHFVADEECGVSRFPHWHAAFERHMADQHRKSSLISLYLPGNHAAAIPIWLNWQMQAHPFLNERFEMMWRTLVIAR